MSLHLRPRPPRSRAVRPSIEGLESREVLSTMIAPHAEIAALRMGQQLSRWQKVL